MKFHIFLLICSFIYPYSVFSQENNFIFQFDGNIKTWMIGKIQKDSLSSIPNQKISHSNFGIDSHGDFTLSAGSYLPDKSLFEFNINVYLHKPYEAYIRWENQNYISIQKDSLKLYLGYVKNINYFILEEYKIPNVGYAIQDIHQISKPRADYILHNDLKFENIDGTLGFITKSFKGFRIGGSYTPEIKTNLSHAQDIHQSFKNFFDVGIAVDVPLDHGYFAFTGFFGQGQNEKEAQKLSFFNGITKLKIQNHTLGFGFKFSEFTKNYKPYTGKLFSSGWRYSIGPMSSSITFEMGINNQEEETYQNSVINTSFAYALDKGVLLRVSLFFTDYNKFDKSKQHMPEFETSAYGILSGFEIIF